MEGIKKCGKCQMELPIDRFSPHRRMKSGLQTYCKICARAWHREHPEYVKEKAAKWKAQNPNYARDQQRKRKLGVTREEVEKIRTEQNNMCAGCLLVFEDNRKNREHLDHCHATKTVRGLLCRNCNSLLGMCNDNVETLMRLCDYLEMHKTRAEAEAH